MKREIYEVNAQLINSQGSWSTLNGYPKRFDSKSYDNDCEKAKNRAYGAYRKATGDMYDTYDSRELQVAYIIRVSDGVQIEKECIGKLADIEPEPETPEETEPEAEPVEGGEG